METAIVLTLLLIWVIQRNFRTILRQLISMGTGALIPILITVIYFWSHGILKEMYDSAITYNLIYSQTKLSSTPPGVAGFHDLGVIAWIGLIGFGIALILWIRQWRAKSSAILLFLIIGCPLAVFTSDPAQRNYAHYFINWLPFISLLGGLTLYTLQTRLTSYLKNTAGANLFYTGFALIVVVFLFVKSGQASKNWMVFADVLNRSEIEHQSIVALYVEEHTKPNDPVLVWGGFTDINFMSHRVSPTAYVLYPELLSSNLSVQYSNQFLVDIQKNRPILIIDMNQTDVPSINPQRRAAQIEAHKLWPYLPANTDEVLSFINSNYHLETILKDTAIYRLNGTSEP